MTEQEVIERIEMHGDNCGFENSCADYNCEKCHEARDMAIIALEKQVPQRVVYISGGESGYICPKCENFLDHTIPNYCCKCGQRIELGDFD